MEETPKSKHSKFFRMFVDVDKMEKTVEESYERVNVSEKIEYVGKVFFFILLLLFLVSIILAILGIGGSEFRQVGFMIPMALFPLLVIFGAALSFSKSFKKTNPGIQSSTGNKNDDV